MIIKQRHNMGCGIACVASAVNERYDNVLIKCENLNNALDEGFYMPELKKLLKLYGKNKYIFRRYSSKYKQYLTKQGTIIFISKCKKYPYGHYLNKIESGWMNPWINCPIISLLKAGIDKSIKEEQIEYILFEFDKHN